MTYPWQVETKPTVWQPWAKPTQPERWWEQPKAWGETAQERIGEGISKVPILPEALQFVAPAFEFIHEKLEVPFAAIITSPFSPTLDWKKGESWLEHEKREYQAWKAPTYVKGLTEFAMPLWWMPWFAWAKVGAKALGVGARSAALMTKAGKTLSVAEKGLPSSELLDKALFKTGKLPGLIRATEKVPVVNKLVKMVGGEAAFAHPTAADPLNVTRRALVKMGFVDSMKDGIRSIHVPKLQVLGNQNKILGMDAKGVVGNIVDKSGKSQYLYDVLEGAIKNPDNYKFVTKEAKQYVETLKGILDDVYKLAKQEGVKVPKGTIVHRIVKGKTSPLTGVYEASDYGSLFEFGRSHKFMAEGVKAGVDYGLDVAESVSSTINHYVKAISRKRFEKEVGKLGKSAKEMWESLPESIELNLLKAAEKEAVLTQPERLAELILMKKDFMKRYAGSKQILGEQMAKFSRHPVFKNKIFPKEVVKTAEKLLNDDSQRWLQNMANISGTSRMLTAAMDLSAPFIQGAALMGRNPVAWGKAVGKMLEFAAKPNNFYKYVTDPMVSTVRMQRIMAGGSAQTFEYFKALAPLQRQIKKIPKVGAKGEQVFGQTYGRAEMAFTGFGEVARNEMWKALAREGMSPEKLMEIARTVDRMTGVMSTEALAISKTQQDFENAFVFFAPRYTRAGLSFVGDALKGGLSGAEARKAIGALSGGGLAMYYGICKALDQEPNLNPNSGRFMTIKVGESHIGIGGIMTALIRFGYDVAVTAVEDPENLIKPISEGKLNRWDNPFIRFLYARAAPLTGTIMGNIEQTNYFGEPFESVADWGEFMAGKITPIALQGAIRDPQAETIIAEFGGLRAFPKSPWELLDEERDRLSIAQYGQPYDNLNDLQQTRINKSEEVRNLTVKVNEQTVVRGGETEIAFVERDRERDAARKTYEESLWNLQKAIDDGVIDGVEFRERMADAGYGLGKTYEHIDAQPRYKPVMDVYKEPRKLKDKNLVDIAYSEFMDTLYATDEQGNSRFEDQYGLFQYDKYNQFIEAFRQKWGDEVYQYVQEMKVERDKDLPPMAKEYQIAKEVMKPYWEIQTKVEKMFGKSYAESTYGKRMITKLRQQMRMTNPNIEAMYQKFYAR